MKCSNEYLPNPSSVLILVTPQERSNRVVQRAQPSRNTFQGSKKCVDKYCAHIFFHVSLRFIHIQDVWIINASVNKVIVLCDSSCSHDISFLCKQQE